MQLIAAIAHTYRTITTWLGKAIAFTFKWAIRIFLLAAIIGPIVWGWSPIETGAGPRARWDVARVYHAEWQAMSDECRGENASIVGVAIYTSSLTILTAVSFAPAFILAPSNEQMAQLSNRVEKKARDLLHEIWQFTTRKLFEQPCGFTRPEELTEANFTSAAAGATTDSAASPSVSATVYVAPDIPTTTYVVQPGDTPFGVALAHGIDVKTLIALNAERYPGMAKTPMQFNAGWTIHVPASGGAPASVVVAVAPTAQAATPTPAANTGGGYFDYDGALEIVRLTNEARAAAGQPSLTVDEWLMEIARKRAQEIVADWGHQGLADDCGNCGENIVAEHGGGPQTDFNLWINSPGHHDNLLDGLWKSIGVARFVHNGRVYAVQVFRCQ